MARSLRHPGAFAIAILMVAMAACGAGDPAVGDRTVNGVQAEGLGAAGRDETATTTTGAVSTDPGLTTTTSASPDSAAAGIVVIPTGGAPLSEAAGAEPFMQIHEGIPMGFLERDGEWLQVSTMCNEPAWVNAADVEVSPQATPAPRGPGFDIGQATIVLDPGHGERDWGGVGPNNLGEKNVNIDIAAKLRTLMQTGHAVDWATGAITEGADVPAFGTVWLTRDPAGPADGDYEAALGFRADFANAAGADAFVSIHNNTVPRIDTEIPGTEVFYAVSVDDSDRLASLIHEELLRSFEPFEADWKGGEILGARARIDPETDTDYYGILRRAEMPAVIVEGVYISEADQEALLATDEFRQAYADGVYRGLVRFLTTDETGTEINPPELFPDDAGTVNTTACVIPEQP